jgi:hypothetical protein
MTRIVRSVLLIAALALPACVSPAPTAGGDRGIAADVPLPPPTPNRPEPQSVTIVAVGDIMMGSDFPSPLLHPALIPGARAEAVLDGRLLEILRGADLAVGNMEGTLFDGYGPHKTCSNPAACYVFRSPEHYAEILADAGFDLMALANNHSGDFAEAGRDATIAALARNGIGSAGIDAPGARTAGVTLDGGQTVGFAAFAPNWGTLPITDIPRAARIVAELAAGHDLVVVGFHGGAEGRGYTRVPRTTEMFLGENRGNVFAFSRAMIDAGADLVVGHGPHVPRAVEVYNERLIAYSLGNFWTYGRMNIRGLGGVGPLVEAELAPDGELLAARIHGTRQIDRGIPQYDPSNEAARTIAQLTAADFPEVPLTIAPDGTLTGPGIGPGAPAY